MIPDEFEYEDKSNGFVWLVLCCLTGIVSLCIIFLSCHPAKRITRVRVTVENKAEIEVYTKTDSAKLKSR